MDAENSLLIENVTALQRFQLYTLFMHFFFHVELKVLKNLHFSIFLIQLLRRFFLTVVCKAPIGKLVLGMIYMK